MKNTFNFAFLHLCIEIRPKSGKKVKNTRLPEVRVCTLRKYAKCTKVEKSSKRKLRNSLTAVQFLLMRLFGKLSRRCTTQNFKVYIWWLKEKMQNAKAAFFCLRGQVFFTTMTRFIFVNQNCIRKLKSTLDTTSESLFLNFDDFFSSTKNESSTPAPFRCEISSGAK